jgi:hypothetical protein
MLYMLQEVSADLQGLENIHHYKHTRQASLPCPRRRPPLLLSPLPQGMQQVRIEYGGGAGRRTDVGLEGERQWERWGSGLG